MNALDLGEAAFTKVPKKVNIMHSQMEYIYILQRFGDGINLNTGICCWEIIIILTYTVG